MSLTAWLLVAVVAMFALPAAAGQPEPWQFGFQTPANPLAEDASRFHDFVLVIMIAIAMFVLLLMAYVMWRFREASNPSPSRTTQNALLEVVWTAVPVLILAVIALPSMRLLYAYDQVSEAEITIRAIGHQWYWSYEYPEHGDFTFDARMVRSDALAAGQPRLLATDLPVVLPADTAIRVLVTADDVIHAWAVPAFFVKVDAVPGRVNELLIAPVAAPGMYYGQCSELCGRDHSFMPIAVKIVPRAEFDDWVTEAQAKFARVSDGAEPPLRVADTRKAE